jgi:hypothetical protein
MIFETSFDNSHKGGIAFDLVEFPHLDETTL